MTTTTTHGSSLDMTYLGDSRLEPAEAEDVRGMVVVDMNGHRIGEVKDLVVDLHQHRVRLLSVVSGGILGMVLIERLIPVEAVVKVDDRVHVARSKVDVHAPDARPDDEA